MGGRQSLDALRANRLRQQGIAETEESGGLTAGKAMLIILLMLVVGAGGAYVYFKISTPRVHSSAGTGSSSRSSTLEVSSAGNGASTSLAPNHTVVFTLMSGPEHPLVTTVYRPKS
jgi:hypothetical protein